MGFTGDLGLPSPSMFWQGQRTQRKGGGAFLLRLSWIPDFSMPATPMLRGKDRGLGKGCDDKRRS